ncbi:hypothetical protein V7S43_009326 [Phytophthora oleae]|uniref:Uncharacterized protein n=1 Tax=Phytophthora oleae TaxID=2107226 RepID=A0ABD3FJK3_9STRA
MENTGGAAQGAAPNNGEAQLEPTGRAKTMADNLGETTAAPQTDAAHTDTNTAGESHDAGGSADTGNAQEEHGADETPRTTNTASAVTDQQSGTQRAADVARPGEAALMPLVTLSSASASAPRGHDRQSVRNHGDEQRGRSSVRERSNQGRKRRRSRSSSAGRRVRQRERSRSRARSPRGDQTHVTAYYASPSPPTTRSSRRRQVSVPWPEDWTRTREQYPEHHARAAHAAPMYQPQVDTRASGRDSGAAQARRYSGYDWDRWEAYQDRRGSRYDPRPSGSRQWNQPAAEDHHGGMAQAEQAPRHAVRTDFGRIVLAESEQARSDAQDAMEQAQRAEDAASAERKSRRASSGSRASAGESDVGDERRRSSTGTSAGLYGFRRPT